MDTPDRSQSPATTSEPESDASAGGDAVAAASASGDGPAAAAATDAPTDASGKPRKLYREDFDWGEVIGEGAYGEVQLATVKETGITYAVKILNKKHIIAQKKVAWVNREKVLLDRLRHPNIVDLFYTFSDPDNLHFVLELCPNGELLDQIKKHGCLSLTCTRFCVAEIVSACEFMHMVHGVAHRDVKPENILIGNGGHMKFVDFGTAKELGVDRKARSKSFVGTAEYVSPELLRDKEAGLAADLWAVGCMVYQLLTGRLPFRAPNEYLTFQRILGCDIIYPLNFPPVARDLLNGLLEMDPDKRLGFREPGGYDELKSHPFFEGIDWATLPQQTPPPFGPPDEMPIWPEKEDDKAEQQKPPDAESAAQTNGGAATAGGSPSSAAAVGAATSTDSTSSSSSSATASASSNGAGGDDDKKASDRAAKLEQQKSSPWAQFLRPDELILHHSLITKKKGFFTRKRQLVLTDGPRLFYIDPDKMIVKGEIPWGRDMAIEFKNDKLFIITVPGRAYRLGEVQGEARKWVDVLQPLLTAQNNPS